jgi:oleate hydratase
LVTFKDSNWLMSIVVPYQPHFINQPPDVGVFCGYGLFPHKLGNFVQKKMSDCSGEEFLIELCSHLGFGAQLPRILASAICIPCMMPYITSQFLVRQAGDRPRVVPEGSINLAFIGQFCEIEEDVVFTVEYSVRSAQTAVYKLLKIDKEPPALYQGQRDLLVFIDAIETMFS